MWKDNLKNTDHLVECLAFKVKIILPKLYEDSSDICPVFEVFWALLLSVQCLGYFISLLTEPSIVFNGSGIT